MSRNFLLVSLNDKKAKKIASVIKNPSCKKILDYLAGKERSTETEISKKLEMPISTVHYSIKQLVEAKLVKSDEYTYSEKGKEINHYKLANKYVIIAPEEDKKGLREKLKTIIPVALITGALGFVASLFGKSIGSFGSSISTTKIMAAQDMATESAQVMTAEVASFKSAPIASQASNMCGVDILTYFGWFIFGAITGIGIYLLIKYLIKRFS
ncbi:helix-turn-helix transcriptional regulator [Candidatus Woesearchaeota archaeon]|jgi:DNA-binding transcriptional ArsR family regulator|nr:helix-turn-helix transcriptional regulator [Candidatus Woesearchaeota archaeon]